MKTETYFEFYKNEYVNDYVFNRLALCVEGYYLKVHSDFRVSCDPCPENMECTGGYVPIFPLQQVK